MDNNNGGIRLQPEALKLFRERGYVEIYSKVLGDWFALARSPWKAAEVREGVTVYLPQEITAITEGGVPDDDGLRALHWAKGIFSGKLLDKKRIAQERKEAELKKNLKTKRPWHRKAA